MRKSFLTYLCLVLVAALGIVQFGCECPVEKPAEPVVYAPYVAPPPPPYIPPSSPSVCPVTDVVGGMARVRLALPTGDVATSVVLVEKMAPAQVIVGQTYDTTIKVTNLIDCELQDVVVKDELPEGFVVASTNPTGSVTGGEIVWNVGKLAARDSVTFVVSGSSNAAGKVVDCALITYNRPVCLAVDAIAPKIALTKTAPAEVLICDPIPVTFVVSNTGTGMARNVMVEDNLPAGLTTMSGESKLVLPAGDLATGQSRELSATLKATRTGTLDNSATATAEGGLTASASTSTVVRQPVLAITKTGQNKAYIGNTLQYTISVSNKGDGVAKDTVVDDTLPMGTVFVSADQGGMPSQGRVIWRLGDLAPGASKDMAVSVRAAQSVMKTRNVATATAYCADAVSATVESDLLGIPAVLLEVVDDPDPVRIGDETTYTITATNQGSALGTNITITCELEDEAQYVGCGGCATPAMQEGQKIAFAPLPELAPKASATWRVKVKALKAADTRFHCNMTTDQTAPRPIMETESTHFYE